MSHDSSLEPILRAVEPAARLIPERHLHQILAYLNDLGGSYPTNTDLPYWISREELLAAEILPRRVFEGTEAELLLLVDPDDRMLSGLPREEQLREYWRVLYEAAILREIDKKTRAGALTAPTCTERLNQFGPAAAREIGYVLESMHLTSRGCDDVVRYRTFAAVYLGLASFRGQATEDFFPSLPHGEHVPRALSIDVNPAQLLADTRPAGAASPHREPEPEERWIAADTYIPPSPARAVEARSLLEEALQAEQHRNFARAAVLRTQVAAGVQGEERELALSAAQTAIGQLVESLGEMFDWDRDTRQEWRQALAPLLAPASIGRWPRAARCLYELQKLPADLSREVFAVDLAESLRTFGRRPVKRQLPLAKPVLILMGLKKAESQMLRAGLGHAASLRLDRLFHHQIHRLEHDVRDQYTPIVTGVLSEAGLIPTNTVEEVARDKIVAELLDRVCERGYLRFGDLRDAIARNRLKLGDLSGPGEFLRGDILLRADIGMAYTLDGVYRKGEVYLRGLQRASSLFFANAVGRALFLYLLLPFAAGFGLVVFAQEMAHLAEKSYSFIANFIAPKPTPAVAQAGTQLFQQLHDTVTRRATPIQEVEFDPETGEPTWNEPVPLINIMAFVFTSSATSEHKAGSHAVHIPWAWVGGLTVLFFLTIHVPRFRQLLWASLRLAGRLLRKILWDFPLSVWRSRTIRGLWQSRPIRLLVRHFWTPFLLSALVLGALILLGASRQFLFGWGWAIWAGLTIVYNTPWGLYVQERFSEKVSDWWRVLRVNLLPGLLGWLVYIFRQLANWVERQLYAVDERLRFRGGDSQSSLAIKAILGLVWFPIAYITRFAFNLLLEPQVNPVKHFPVVTISHKLLLPLVPSVAGWLTVSNYTAFVLVGCVPGIFGFIAWELLSNWRLYRANRPHKLQPILVGSHGESMRGLLRPGFHSGTVPRIFRKLRTANRTKADHLHHDLNHVAEATHRFVERELVALLAHTPEWSSTPLQVGGIHFGCQRLAVELLAPRLSRECVILAFENRGVDLHANLEKTGWITHLTDVQRDSLITALRGLLDMSAVAYIDGQPRLDDSPSLPGFEELRRRVSAAEWVARWDGFTKSATG